MGASHRAFLLSLVTYLLVVLALLSLKSAEPKMAYVIDLTVAITEMTVLAWVLFTAIQLSLVPEGAAYYRWVAAAFGAALFSGTAHLLARFGFGLGWSKLGGTAVELGISLPHLIFLALIASLLIHRAIQDGPSGSVLVGLATSVSLFIAGYTATGAALSRPLFSDQSRGLHAAHLVLESLVGGFGVLTLLLGGAGRERLLTVGFLVSAFAAFLHQLLVLYRLGGWVSAMVVVLSTLGGMVVSHALSLTQEIVRSSAPARRLVVQNA